MMWTETIPCKWRPRSPTILFCLFSQRWFFYPRRLHIYPSMIYPPDVDPSSAFSASRGDRPDSQSAGRRYPIGQGNVPFIWPVRDALDRFRRVCGNHRSAEYRLRCSGQSSVLENPAFGHWFGRYSRHAGVDFFVRDGAGTPIRRMARGKSSPFPRVHMVLALPAVERGSGVYRSRG